MVVLGGSSGRVDVDRARLFTGEGATALALQWFGGEGQVPGICEIPLETFFAAADHLSSLGCQRIIFVGTSKGAEASLLAAAHDPRIDAVIAISPSSVVWGNIGPGRDGVSWPERSSWSLAGKPLPFVPADVSWEREYAGDLVSYRGLFEQSLKSFALYADTARIPVDATAAEIVLIAGAGDALWPSLWFAEDIRRQRAEVGKPTRVISAGDAGHRVLLPGETTPRSTKHAHGCNDDADAKLGLLAWPYIQQVLRRT